MVRLVTLAERIVANPDIPGYLVGDGPRYQEHVRAAMKVEATNVYRWCDENLQGKVIVLEDVDCGFPPSENLWIEWWPYPDLVEGAHVLTFDRAQLSDMDAAEWVFKDARVTHVVCSSIFVAEIVGCPMMGGTATAALDSDGRILWCRTMLSDVVEKFSSGMDPEDGRRLIEKGLDRASVVFAYTCSFANCANVSMVDGTVSRQVARRAARKHEYLPTFRVLKIDPMEEVFRRHRAGGPKTDVRQGLHICRGHFSKYGEKFGRGKLFGKLEGRFWVPKHVRGNSELGIIEKEYEVVELKTGGKKDG